MAHVVNITDFRKNISTYIDKIIYQKEVFVLTKGNKIVAKVVAYRDTREQKAISPLLKLAGLWSDSDVDKFEQERRSIQEKSKNDVLLNS